VADVKITVLYFAALREAMDRASDVLELPPNVTTVALLRAWLIARGATWDAACGTVKRLRAAVDQQMATDATALRDGAEGAFFPPVTGG
jgi:molybdopterin synthase sulfur carrier subunit